MTQNIVLVGFMGTGKTAVAHALTQKIHWNLVDTDELVEQSEQKKISEIFSEHGEEYFRDAESRVIREVMQKDKQIVSTGGGAVLREANREHMLNSGWVIALLADAATIIQRIKQDVHRPLLEGDLDEKVIRLLKERRNAYDFAHEHIDTSRYTIDEIAEMILEQFDRYDMLYDAPL